MRDFYQEPIWLASIVVQLAFGSSGAGNGFASKVLQRMQTTPGQSRR